LHQQVRGLAAFDLADEPAARLGEVAQCAAAREAFPPLRLLVARVGRALAGADGYEDADVAPGPFVDYGLVEDLRGRVELACAFVEEDRLADLDGLECQAGRARRSSGLPDCAVELRGGLLARVVASQEDRAPVRRCALVDCGNRSRSFVSLWIDLL